jgi:hypothetical protein
MRQRRLADMRDMEGRVLRHPAEVGAGAGGFTRRLAACARADPSSWIAPTNSARKAGFPLSPVATSLP